MAPSLPASGHVPRQACSPTPPPPHTHLLSCAVLSVPDSQALALVPLPVWSTGWKVWPLHPGVLHSKAPLLPGASF